MDLAPAFRDNALRAGPALAILARTRLPLEIFIPHGQGSYRGKPAWPRR